MRRARRIAAWTVVFLLVVIAATAWWIRHALAGSLAVLDGQTQVAGLSAPVTVARDFLGIPRITGATRNDVARATGFVHAQDRFFQMDLSRRRAAGELSALVGARALPVDRAIRIHRFRDVARRAVTMMSREQRQLLDAYADGVNAGLVALRSKPFEYFVLRQDPQPWRAEDSFLVALAMFITLQEPDGAYESTLATIDAVLPRQMVDFLVPEGTDWDAPIVGDRLPAAPIPPREVYDLRTSRGGRDTAPRPARPRGLAWLNNEDGREGIGSNNWVVGPALSSTTSPIVANDMHLDIRVPNTWYRALLEWREADGPHMLVGVTLPGVPALIIGSNGNVAWGFTSTYADTSDIVMLDTDPSRPNQYRTPDGWRPFERFTETIDVAGADAESVAVDWTIWGPVLEPDYAGRSRAYRWVAHDAERLAVSIAPLERARTVGEAVDEANRLGTPALNFVVADRNGSIGWSVYGSLPHREGIDGSTPVSWADGGRGWLGLLDAADYPRVIDPPSGRIWTANARVVDRPMLDALGNGNWEMGSRARIIRDRLFARDSFTPGDMLAIQMDARAEFLERWRQLALDSLTPSAVAGSPTRQAFRDVVETGWNGEASPDSAAYRLTRMFRDEVALRVFSFVLAECYDRDPTFDYFMIQRREGPLWALVSQKPLHLLDPAFATWESLLTTSVDAIVTRLQQQGAGDLRSQVWSQMNVTDYRHPLSAGLPFLSRWLDMPSRALPGDLYTPQMHWRAQGASERMVVSPGHEAEGIMHMPTGQSGHPLSPYYANSHEAWVEGRPTPLMPGRAEHTLTLTP